MAKLFPQSSLKCVAPGSMGGRVLTKWTVLIQCLSNSLKPAQKTEKWQFLFAMGAALLCTAAPPRSSRLSTQPTMQHKAERG